MLSPLPTHAATGDMFGGKGYVAAEPWMPAAHNTADMFPHTDPYVSTGADMFSRAALNENTMGGEDMFPCRPRESPPPTALFNWPSSPYPQ